MNEESRPGVGTGTASKIMGGDLKSSLRQELDNPPQPTSCPCGHDPQRDEDCVRQKPLPVVVGCGACQALDLDQRETAALRGYFCGPNSCARRLLGLVV